MTQCSDFEGVWNHLDALSAAESERLASHLCECHECRDLELTVRSLHAFTALAPLGDVATQRRRFERRLGWARALPVIVLTCNLALTGVVVWRATERQLGVALVAAAGMVLGQVALWFLQRRWYHEASVAERTGALEGFLAHDTARSLASAREGRWTIGGMGVLLAVASGLPFMPVQAAIPLGLMAVISLGWAVALHLQVRRARR